MRRLMLVLLFFPSLLLAKEYSFNVDFNRGDISTFFIAEGNKVYRITQSIDAIYIFNSHARAQSFVAQPNTRSKPSTAVNVGDTRVYVDKIDAIDYYTSNSMSGSAGQVKSINGLSFSYLSDSSTYKNAGVVGKLSKVGNTKVTYWVDAGYTVKGKYRGKIRTLGNQSFKYESWSSWGEKNGMVGKLISLGPINIDYYDTDYDLGYKGKLKSVGKVNFSYYRDTSTNQKANIVGKFKEQKGRDSRLTVY
ncbi:hypothetical protein UA32_12870 [Photobacterium angustum]|uniref:Uncharacterized protein n=1 Tax=Photobacterium angustum TaxID=661 RepID=A0ABX5H0Y2_PHOAN|nr:hypothetical protein [Photobacterium angustum]KJG37521.1 hypothetical protein UA32_12870 [Photobacterium angustum]PSX05898.1 hypothetical protein C0W27_17700 [Photobacterium angustum]